MRVLHVFKTYLPDSFTGIERVIWEIAEQTATRGVRNRVFYLTNKTPNHSLSIDHHSGYSVRADLDIASTPLSLSAFRHFRRLAREADIIHYHFPWPMMDLLHLATRPTVPTVVTYHSDVVRQKSLLQVYKPVMHRFLKSVDRIVATSPNYIDSSPVLARYRAKTLAIPIGLDPRKQQVASQDRIQFWQERLPRRFFLFLGAPRYYKGLSFLLDAARVTGLPVVLAGAGEFPPTDTLPSNVMVVGKVDDEDKAALLHLCEAFLFPSHLRSEAFGVALLEAAFAGKALVSCEIGTGTSYINENGVTGLVVPPANVSALSAAMKELWSAPAQARQYGEAARERAHRIFGANAMGEAYLKIYSRLAGRSPEHGDDVIDQFDMSHD